MVISERALRRLFPPGHPFKLPGAIGTIISGLAVSFERLRAFFLQIPSESVPKTAVLTLPAWFTALGLAYDPTRALADLQAQADNAWSLTGGQSLAYLNAQIQRELPQVYIAENLTTSPQNSGIPARSGIARSGQARASASDPSMIYSVFGTVTDRPHYNRLVAILARIAPLHLAYIWLGTITSELAMARANIAQSGLARTGKVA